MNSIKILVVSAMLFSISALAEDAGCQKDTDCKGERICKEHECVDPVHELIPAVEETQPAVQADAPQTVVVADSKIEKQPDRLSYGLGFNAGIMGIITEGKIFAAPEVGMYGELAGYVADSFAVGGFADLQYGFDGSGKVTLMSIGPEVKFGRKLSATFGLGITLGVATPYFSSVPMYSGLLPSAIIRGSIPIAGPLCLHLGLLTVFGNGVLLGSTVGVGYTQ